MSNYVPFVRPLEKHDPKKLAWCEDLCRKYRDELGAVHLGVLAAHATLGHVALAEGAGQYLGCLVTKPELKEDPRIFPIIAAAVPSDIRRLHVGLSMLHHVAAIHALDRSRIFQAKCRLDLPSNLFWAAAGFYPIAVQHSTSVRAKPLIVWRRRCDGSANDVEHVVPAARQRMGGGRFVPKDRPDLANILDFSAEGVEAALRVSGARPIVGGWERVDWDQPQKRPPVPIVRPERPGSSQLKLFSDLASIATAEHFFENGR